MIPPPTNQTPAATGAPVPERPRSHRIAAIDWIRGFVMLLMIVDHAAMAFDRTHLDHDSALYTDASTMALPAAEFFTRWMTHLCAPTFVFLAGTALALSVERRVAKGINAWEIDRGILVRGVIIALLDVTVISLGIQHLSLSVLFAIGMSMIAMTALRRLPTMALVAFGLGWFAAGEWITGFVWRPPGAAPEWAAVLVATSGAGEFSIKYPIIPWLAIMSLGWALGRQMVRFAAGESRLSPRAVLLVAGIAGLALFVAVRWANGYGTMFLPRADSTWQQWLHVSKYPPSLDYAALELGLMAVLLAVMMWLEPIIGFRENGPLLVFGQTAMFYYLVHRFVFDATASYGGLHGVGTITTTYVVAIAAVIVLYPACLWFRRIKTAHPDSFLRYL